MAKSRKKSVIEQLFSERWDDAAQALTNPMVTLDQTQQAIRAFNAANPNQKPLSDRNPANFAKDFVRKRKSSNKNWPESVLARGYTARQVTGEGNCFEFIRLGEGQTVPFPIETFAPTANTVRHKIESVSLPLASRRLGRKDETWLVQVLVRLRVLETHFAMYSPHNAVQLDHLQMGIKLNRTEIDALFLATVAAGAPRTRLPQEGLSEIIVCCEAKGLNDDILVDQLLRQLVAVFRLRAVKQDIAIAIAAKAIGPSEVYVVECEAVTREQVKTLERPTIVSEAIYEFWPPIPGIGR